MCFPTSPHTDISRFMRPAKSGCYGQEARKQSCNGRIAKRILQTGLPPTAAEAKLGLEWFQSLNHPLIDREVVIALEVIN